ncbi:MAG: hypothetical protein AAF265_05550 [Pseudomonadota bacterium]
MKRLTMILMLVSAGAPSFASAGVFSDLPDVLTCSVYDPIDVQPWNELVFYVSALLEDGSVLYKSLTSNPVVLVVQPDGVVDAENLADCDNRSVAELRKTGRARDF